MADEQLPASTASEQDDEISLLDILIVLAKHKKLVIGFPLVVAVVTALVTLLLPNIYTATARILPPQQNQSSAMALLAQLGGVASTLGASSLGIKNPSDLYVGMLKSRTIADALIERFKLRELYDKDTLVDTRKKLEGVSDISAGKDGIISIAVDDKDPKRAAAMANAYVEQLDKLTQNLALTDAAQRRLFFGRQLKATKEDLANAEVELRKTQEATGLIQPDEQGKAIITAIATLQAGVIQKEAEIAGMGSFATSQNPDYVKARDQLTSLKSQLADMQKKHNVNLDGSVMMSTGNIPQAGLDYVRKLREVKYQEQLFQLLVQQYELAKMDEAKDAAIIQVVDRAVAPDRKSKPRRALVTLLAGLFALFFGAFLAFLHDAYDRAGRDSVKAVRLNMLRQFLGFRGVDSSSGSET